MASEDQKTVIVEKEGRRSSSGPVVAIVAVIALILLVMFGLPYLTGGGGSSTDVNVTPAPTTGQ